MINKLHDAFQHRNVWVIGVAFLLGAVLALTGINYVAASPDAEGDVVMVINGQAITKDDFFARLEQEAGEAIIIQLISETLISQAEGKDGIVVTDDEIEAELAEVRQGFPTEEAFLQALAWEGYTLEQLINDIKGHLVLQKLVTKGIDISEDEIVAFFEQNKADLAEPETLRVRHILVESKEEADAIIKEINTGASFTELASLHSIDEGSAQNGGLVGLIDTYSPLVEPFKEAAFLLDAGQTSPPVESAYGWHIIRVDERFPERQADLDEYRELIRQHLMQEQARPVGEVLDELADASEIDIRWEKYRYIVE